LDALHPAFFKPLSTHCTHIPGPQTSNTSGSEAVTSLGSEQSMTVSPEHHLSDISLESWQRLPLSRQPETLANQANPPNSPEGHAHFFRWCTCMGRF
jgi:hypothetical protein